jgi:hypothetical protein
MLLVLTAGAGCGGTFTPTMGETSDAGPDQAARAEFASNVAPVMAQKCDSCHKTGSLGAPMFESTYESVTTYQTAAAGQKFLSCTDPANSWLIQGCKATGHPGMPFDATAEPIVTTWAMHWAMQSPTCMGMTAAKAQTAPIILQQGGGNTVDLSTLGPGLDGATLTFSADTAGTGLYISNVTLHAGTGGLHVKHPVFDSCQMAPPEKDDPSDTYAQTDVIVQPSTTGTLPALALTNASLTTKLSIRFEELTPSAGSAGPAVDNGGACAP